jgi:hypothetical protein
MNIEKSKWGDPQTTQLKAEFNGYMDQQAPVYGISFMGLTLRKPGFKIVEKYIRLNTELGDEIPDDMVVTRYYRFRCGLRRAVCGFNKYGSQLALYLDGMSNTTLNIGSTRFDFDPQLEGVPIVDLWFRGTCSRYGKMENGRSDQSAVITFRDQKHMDEYVLASCNHSG